MRLAAAAIISFCMVAVYARTVEQMTPGQEFIETLPEYERPDYFTFELGRGYSQNNFSAAPERSESFIAFPESLDIPEERVKRFKTLETPDNFTTNLYSFVQNEFHLDHDGMRALILVREVCFESGHCIDIDDVGSLCCPF